MKKIKYTTVEDLLIDEGFLAWYHQDNAEVEKWDKWIEESQEHQSLAKEAIDFLKLMLLAGEKDEVAEDRIRAVFSRITNAIVTYEEQQRSISIKQKARS